jgi:hypothetical protein
MNINNFSRLTFACINSSTGAIEKALKFLFLDGSDKKYFLNKDQYSLIDAFDVPGSQKPQLIGGRSYYKALFYSPISNSNCTLIEYKW